MNKMKHDDGFAKAQAGATAVAGAELRQIVERIERLEIDKKAIADDIKEFYAEAKGRGYCTKTIRKVIKERARDGDERDEAQAMFDLYWDALGG